MLIFTHITISILSLGLASGNLLRPSSAKLRLSYATIVLATLSGALLATVQDLNIVYICTVGIFYTTIVTFMTVMGGRKLASLELED